MFSRVEHEKILITLGPDLADAQADFSLCMAHMPFCLFVLTRLK